MKAAGKPGAPGGGAAARRAAERRGRRGERAAAWWLRLKGYRILAQGFRLAVGEIDLVARRGAVLAFVEVKSRPDLGEAAAAIGPVQRQRIARAAEAFLQRHPGLAALSPRFDAILVAPGRWPRHIENAWRIGDTP